MAGVDPSRAQGLILALATEAERAGDDVGRYERADAQPALAEALAGVEEWEWAERVAGGITDGGTRAEALAALAQALTGAGELDRAERVAGGITQAKERALALATVAGALVGVDPGRALAVTGQAEDAARAIPSRYERGKALAAIVERLAAAIEPDPPGPGADDPLRRRVRRLLGEVLAGERWLDALEPLGRLDPDALAAVDRELHG